MNIQDIRAVLNADGSRTLQIRTELHSRTRGGYSGWIDVPTVPAHDQLNVAVGGYWHKDHYDALDGPVPTYALASHPIHDAPFDCKCGFPGGSPGFVCTKCGGEI